MFTPNQTKVAPSMGYVQNNFVYRLRQFIANDQFKIVEDMPASKLIRNAHKTTANGKPYDVYYIRILANNFEADLELFDTELNQLAIACPKDIKNFKGVTLAFDGRRWQYISQDTQNGQGPAQQPDTTTPAYQPPTDPDENCKKIVKDMQYLTSVNSEGYQITAKVMTNICESINKGHALDLIQEAKTKGYIYEQGGVYKVVV